MEGAGGGGGRLTYNNYYYWQPSILLKSVQFYIWTYPVLSLLFGVDCIATSHHSNITPSNSVVCWWVLLFLLLFVFVLFILFVVVFWLLVSVFWGF